MKSKFYAPKLRETFFSSKARQKAFESVEKAIQAHNGLSSHDTVNLWVHMYFHHLELEELSEYEKKNQE